MGEALENIKLETKYYKIEKLLKWEKRDLVDEMIVTGVSPEKVAKWCKEQGFSISKQRMYDYREMLNRAIQKKITVEYLLGMGDTRRTPIVLQTLGMTEATDLVKNEMEVLDAIIQIGMNSLKGTTSMKMADVLRAIELKDKVTGGSHGGLTGYGLDQLRELEEAKFAAIIKVVMKYIPDEKLEEIQDEIEEAERTFYQEYAPEYLDEYDKAIKDRMLTDTEAVAKFRQDAVDQIEQVTEE